MIVVWVTEVTLDTRNTMRPGLNLPMLLAALTVLIGSLDFLAVCESELERMTNARAVRGYEPQTTRAHMFELEFQDASKLTRPFVNIQ